MSTRGILSQMAREQDRRQRQLMREQERQRKAALRAEIRAREKAQKEAYIGSMEDEAEAKTFELIDLYDEYEDCLERTLGLGSDPFMDRRAMFQVEPFHYDKNPPVLIRPELTPVPEESWLDRFSSARREKRQNIIAENEAKTKAAEEEHKAKVEQFEAEKKAAQEAWDAEQKRLKEEYCKEIETQEEAYSKKDPAAFETFINYLMDSIEYKEDLIDSHAVGYQPQLGKAVLDIYMRPRDEIYTFEGYRYMKQKDEIVPVKMKVGTANTRMKALIQTLGLSLADLICRSDDGDAISVLVVNIFHEDICCMSIQVDKQTFLKFDLDDRSQKVAFLNRFVRQAKSLTTNVTAFEYLYQVD